MAVMFPRKSMAISAVMAISALTFLVTQTSYAESEFAAYTGHKYCVGLNSCGSAIWLALWAAGVKDGDTVLSNALTFNAVPSAIYHARAKGAQLLQAGKALLVV